MVALASGVLGVGQRAALTVAHAANAPARTTAAATAPAGAAPLVGGPASPTRLLGQRIMVGFSGTTAPRWLLGAARRGEVGSVILFASNLVSRAQTVALTASLQRAARAGGNPGLLIATDQEGGEVKRLPTLPPTMAPPQMARAGAGTAAAQGRATGSALRRWGINFDLAPVADVPTFTGAFVWQQGRAFSFDAGTVARDASAFALGLQSRRVAAAAKHFPGLGSAPVDTDFKRQELHPSAAQRAAALTPYRTMIPRGLDAVMVSVAGFPADDRTGAVAALSRPIVTGVLRTRLGFGGVAITDSLAAPTGHDERTAGVLAAEAGSDILLYTDSAPGELAALRTALARGRIARADAAASYTRILGLKAKLGLIRGE